jgi:hypothetical protein
VPPPGDSGDLISPSNSAQYSYLANSPLVEQIQLKQGSNVRMTTTKSYEAAATVNVNGEPAARHAIRGRLE